MHKSVLGFAYVSFKINWLTIPHIPAKSDSLFVNNICQRKREKERYLRTVKTYFSAAYEQGARLHYLDWSFGGFFIADLAGTI